MGAVTSGATGPAPWPSFGLSLFASLGFRKLAISLEPEATLPSTSQPTAAGNKARIGTLGGNASGGYCLGPLYIGAIIDAVALNAQGLNAQGQSVSSSKAAHPMLASAGLRLGYALNLTNHLAFVARADALIPLRPVDMHIDKTRVYETPVALARLGLGLNYGF
jgi:hypothetical protein